eukprot:gnl/TRDRNA2_/TRDRNA2_169744_c0_seq1.p1 gnl/TRDRNA2_/TRDRNA2_169744_c0~~gnl/TRDRNA2_/TRDRNA2_169744_c0_seq1.p1  ORF type:complete len:606 (-),score=81.86 gnl/TRDRNA2_/TRDRNA2_169744_c0_seq1:115-1881(-)
MLLVGRPDGRLGTLASSEAAILMSAQQARYISARPMRGVENISVGHNSWSKSGLFSRSVTLPVDKRIKFLSQQLLGTENGPHDPCEVTSRLAALLAGKRDKAVKSIAPFSWLPIRQLEDFVREASVAPVDDVKRMCTRCSLESTQSKGMRATCTLTCSQAREVISGLVQRYADELGIDPEAFDVEQVLPNSLQGFADAESGGTSTFTVSALMTLLRGRRMEKYILGLKVRRRDTRLGIELKEEVDRSRALMRMKATFDAWAALSLDSKMQEEAPVSPTSPTGSFKSPKGRLRRKTIDFEGDPLSPDSQGYPKYLFGRNHSPSSSNSPNRPSVSIPHRPTFTCGDNRGEGAQKDTDQPAVVTDTNASGSDMLAQNVLDMHMLMGMKQKEQELDEQAFCPLETAVNWRVREEYLRVCSMWLGALDESMFSVGSCFARWRDACTFSRFSLTKATPIGIHHNAEAEDSSADMINNVEVLEHFYETRIAQTERLMAFFVIFHRAVKPLSRLWFLSYDMDRTESRLRVASTPAPVPFIPYTSTRPASKASSKGSTCVQADDGVPWSTGSTPDSCMMPDSSEAACAEREYTVASI